MSKVSEYVPLQASYANDPWRVLVVCQLLNLTSRKQVGPLLKPLFERWPNALSMALAPARELALMIRPLGLSNQRAMRLIRMSCEYHARMAACGAVGADAVQELHGCGQYAEDSVRIFCENDLGVVPEDIVLREYVGHRRREKV